MKQASPGYSVAEQTLKSRFFDGIVNIRYLPCVPQ